MTDPAAAPGRHRGPLWRRHRRLNAKDRSQSEQTLSQTPSVRAAAQFASASDLAAASASRPARAPRHALLVGKSVPVGASRKKAASGGRVGYALAMAGAKMSLAPGLSSESLLRLGSPDPRRSVGVQTEPKEREREAARRRARGDDVDLPAPLFACLAPLVSAASLENDLRRQRAKAASVSSAGTPSHLSSPAPLNSRPSIPIILTDEQRPPDADFLSTASAVPPSLSNSMCGTAGSSGVFGLSENGGADAAGSFGSLLHPLKALGISRRKSSTGDSAVDLKFAADEERSSHSGGPPSPLAPSTPSEAHTVMDAAPPHTCRPVDEARARPSSSASWRKLRNVVVWAPFFQQFQRHKYPWIQLAGHQGNFRAGEQGTILKKHCLRECLCLKALMKDVLRPYVPEFRGEVTKESDQYVCMQDLLMEFESPSLMDCKLGLRTYLEEELTKAKDNPTPRADMYEKMVAVDAEEPTEEEHRCRGVTKPRYMQWRETISSTATLGFRIEGIKRPSDANGASLTEKTVSRSSNDFKRTKTREEVKACLKDFTDDNFVIIEKYCKRLRSIAATLECSDFFRTHELIGSSLLFVHDHRGKANIWMIDFGKTMPLPPGVAIDHRSAWVEGNHEDGYLFGLENMTDIFEQLRAERSSAVDADEASAAPPINSNSVGGSVASMPNHAAADS